MSRIAYVNGRYVRRAEARVAIEDRGYQFGDGVYEVCEVREGALVDEGRHLARLTRSLGALRIGEPLSAGALKAVIREVVVRNRVRDGMVYLQATRGVAPRDHGFPAAGVRPSLVVTASATDRRKGDARAAVGVAVVILADQRWRRPEIKSLQLLPNVLAKQAAREQGAYEAWLIDEAGNVTEGASTNAWIVAPGGTLVTRHADRAILAGVTRATLIALLAAEGLALEERPFSREEAYGAAEAFLTSAGNGVMPVTTIDGRPVGEGKPGALTLRLRQKFHAFAEVSPI